MIYDDIYIYNIYRCVLCMPKQSKIRPKNEIQRKNKENYYSRPKFCAKQKLYFDQKIQWSVFSERIKSTEVQTKFIVSSLMFHYSRSRHII
jgi:hypothetical protein